MWKWKFLMWLIRWGSRNNAHLRSRMTTLQLLIQQEFDKSNDHWVTHCVRPKTPPSPVAICPTASRIGIVIQGKLLRDDDFTLRTVEYYRETFPQCPLYVSTWDDEEPTVVAGLETAGATVILSEPPAIKAPSHLNYQIRSSLAGIQAAAADGCEYVLKTRTDTRIYGTNVADFLTGLIDRFPVSGTSQQRGRIAVLDLATRLFIPHHPSDILMFGHTADLLSFWDAPWCQSPANPTRPPCSSFGDLTASLIPEVYLCHKYLQKIGYAFDNSIDSWWRCLADLFVIVDRTAIEHFWPKYNFSQEHRSTTDSHLRNEALCSFRDWLGIMNNRKRSNFQLEQLVPARPNGMLRDAA